MSAVTKSDARRLIAEAAFTETNEDGAAGRTLIHTFAHGGGMMLGADWDLAPALDFVAGAKELRWVEHPVGHDLGVLGADDRAIYFNVRRPAPVDARPDEQRLVDGLRTAEQAEIQRLK